MERLTLLETGFEGYPEDYVSHNLPLIVLSGLASTEDDSGSLLPEKFREGSLTVNSELPAITGFKAEDLLNAFRTYEKSEEQWSGRPVVERSSILGFRFRIVGRKYQLLPRKAKPPSRELGYEPPGSPRPDSKSPPHWILHSPLSPLSPGSPLFPDGVMTSEWISKHQRYIPSVFMCFFALPTDPARNSLVDNQLKTEINNIKATLYRSEHKTKLVVVLLGEASVSESLDLEDRLSNIRRACGLDARTSFFFLPPDVSPADLQAFVDGVLNSLQPGCIEYYRDLTKHARRKKARGNIPAPTAPPTRGTSQTLAALGWGVRYDFKQGVFAEFRQEMEQACRHYTAALEALLGPDGIFETTASWSPRWEESRLLADMVAMRILRCLLWGNSPTTAVQSWSNYRFRLREIVDRRGKGSSNYGWEAWESRWSRMMAELVRRAQLPAFVREDGAELRVFAPAEKIIPIGERIKPFENLHHPGYWYRIAAKHSRRRRRYAQDLPDEDCTPPGQSPASVMASRYGTYDTFLCPEPWQERPNPSWKTYNHAKDIFNAVDRASSYYIAQPRALGENQLDLARELLRNKQYAQAIEVLYHLWKQMRWRRDQWWDLVFEVTRNLRECARQLGDGKALAAAEFELYSNALPLAKGYTYDLMQTGEGLESTVENSVVAEDVVELFADDIASFVSPTFSFISGEGNAGEPLMAQLAITSTAQRGSAPVTFDHIRIGLVGSSHTIDLRNKSSSSGQVQIQNLTLTESQGPSAGDDSPASEGEQGSWTAEASLDLYQGSTMVLEFAVTFREAGPIVADFLTFHLTTPTAKIKYTAPAVASGLGPWWKTGAKGLIKSTTSRNEAHVVQIAPRPPKMELRLPNINEHFYTDEEITLPIEVLNDEDEGTESSLEVRLLAPEGPTAFTWTSEESQLRPPENPEDLPGHIVGELAPKSSKTSSIIFLAPSLPTSYIVEVKVLYHVLSDPSTPVSKILTADFNITRAFEANYEFSPRVHPDPWPSFFSAATISREPESPDDAEDDKGISQRWELTAQIASFTYSGILISKVDLQEATPSPNARATFTPVSPDKESVEIAPQQQIPRSFIVDVAKASLDDRRSVELDLLLAITWHRPNGEKHFTSLLPVNSFLLENGPRVLAAVSYPSLPAPIASNEQALSDEAAKSSSLPLAHLSFTLENPTTHFLSFELSIEGPAREDWAFSGMKLRSLNLLPLSRETVHYRLIPLFTGDDEDGEEGRWIEVRYRVMDVYFRKVLRCLPASGGVREAEGKAGTLMVWIGASGK